MTPELIRFAEQYSKPEHPVLQAITRQTNLRTVYPQMLTGHLQGMVLQWISQWVQPRVVIEIGTFTGYSAFCLSMGLGQGGCVHTIERNPELQVLIEENLGGHGLGTRIHLHIGEALELIPSLPMPIDLAYIDGDKQSYLSFYQLLVPRMRVGGIILADNVWWDGKIVDPEVHDKDTDSIRAMLQEVGHDDRVEPLILPIRDGLILIRVL